MNANFMQASRVNTLLNSIASSAVLLGLTLASCAVPARAADASNFYLKSGDRVCFYGDSITEQRFYGVDVETYVRTRFPDLRVKFVNSGVGGDRVIGGWAGPIDLRLRRDVFPFKPNIVTIMLGMNDAKYRPFDQQIFDVYTNGYEHIIQSLQEHLPGVRIVLIEPSPYDDVTYSPKFPGGYNKVLLKYSAFVRDLAKEHHLECVDFNRPLVDVMKAAEARDPKLAHQVIPGRVHPSPVGELVMAQALLKAWDASPLVAAVTIDAAGTQVVRSDRTTVSGLQKENGTLTWSQQDQSLPFPILGLHENWPQFPPVARDWGSLSFFWSAPKPNWDHTDPAAKMIVHLSGFYHALDQEPLKVTGLPDGDYQLKINGQAVGHFSARRLSRGINLARHHTPMLDQAYDVLSLVWKQVQWRYFAWRGIQNQLSFDHDADVQKAAKALIAALEAQKEQIVDQQHEAAAPGSMHYELAPVKQ